MKLKHKYEIISKQELEQAFAKLPDDIKGAISSETSGSDVSAIAREKKLHIDQTGILNEEIAFVMLGLVKPNQFEPRIKERLSLDATKAKELTQAVNDRMFAPLRVSIMKLSQESNIDIADSMPGKNKMVQNNSDMDRSKILAGIEDGVPGTESEKKPGFVSFADKKLAVPITTVAQKIVIGTPKVDPYREPVE